MDISELKGKTLRSAEVVGDDRILFETIDSQRYVMYHSQNCCECVTIEDICGDLADLIGSPILVAEEVIGESAQPADWERSKYTDSYTWTFYKLDTAAGGVTIRWYGESNGYYSESVDFKRVN